MVDYGEIISVRRPIGVDHVLEHFARRAATERRSSESSFPLIVSLISWPHQDGELTLTRDREQHRAVQTRWRRFWIVLANVVGVGGGSAEPRAVEDPFCIRREPAANDLAAMERHSGKGGW